MDLLNMASNTLNYIQSLQTTLYIEDWIGLRTLDDAGRVKYLTVPGRHLGIARDDMKKYVVPYLVDGLPINLSEEESSSIPRGFSSAMDAAANKVGQIDDVPLLSPFRIEVDE